MFKQKSEEYKSYGTGLTKEDKEFIDYRVGIDDGPGPDREP